MVDLSLDITFAWPELFVAVAAMTLLIYGVYRGNQAVRSVSWLGVGVLFVAALLVLAGPSERFVAFNDLFIVDRFANFSKVLLLLGAALTLILAMPYNARRHSAVRISGSDHLCRLGHDDDGLGQ